MYVFFHGSCHYKVSVFAHKLAGTSKVRGWGTPMFLTVGIWFGTVLKKLQGFSFS